MARFNIVVSNIDGSLYKSEQVRGWLHSQDEDYKYYRVSAANSLNVKWVYISKEDREYDTIGVSKPLPSFVEYKIYQL